MSLKTRARIFSLSERNFVIRATLKNSNELLVWFLSPASRGTTINLDQVVEAKKIILDVLTRARFDEDMGCGIAPAFSFVRTGLPELLAPLLNGSRVGCAHSP